MERVFVCSHFSVAHSVAPPPMPLQACGDYVAAYYFRHSSQVFIHARLLRPDEHEHLPLAQQRDYLAVAMKRAFLESVITGMGSSTLRLVNFHSSKLKADASTQKLCETLLAEIEGQQLGRELVLTSLVTGFAIHLLRHLNVSAGQAKRVSVPELRIRRALEFVQSSYTQKVSLDRIARAVGLSKYHLERVFRRATGLPLRKYMTMLRVENGKRQLESSLKPIVDIALDLGFSDQSHFTNVFKRFTGMTPQAYRRRTKPQFPAVSDKPVNGLPSIWPAKTNEEKASQIAEEVRESTPQCSPTPEALLERMLA